MSAEPPVRHVRTLFISDVHLGTRGCQAELLLDFLRYHDAETIYLVGDIVDGWRLQARLVLAAVAQRRRAEAAAQGAQGRARSSTCPGNHDEFLRDYLGTHFGGIEVRNTDIHETADGRRLLVIHGDQFDVVVRHARWLALLRRLGLYDGARHQHRT